MAGEGAQSAAKLPLPPRKDPTKPHLLCWASSGSTSSRCSHHSNPFPGVIKPTSRFIINRRPTSTPLLAISSKYYTLNLRIS